MVRLAILDLHKLRELCFVPLRRCIFEYRNKFQRITIVATSVNSKNMNQTPARLKKNLISQYSTLLLKFYCQFKVQCKQYFFFSSALLVSGRTFSTNNSSNDETQVQQQEKKVDCEQLPLSIDLRDQIGYEIIKYGTGTLGLTMEQFNMHLEEAQANDIDEILDFCDFDDQQQQQEREDKIVEQFLLENILKK